MIMQELAIVVFCVYSTKVRHHYSCGKKYSLGIQYIHVFPVPFGRSVVKTLIWIRKFNEIEMLISSRLLPFVWPKRYELNRFFKEICV